MITPHRSAAKAASASKAPPQNTLPLPPTKEIAVEIAVKKQIETELIDPPTAPPATNTVTEHTPAIARAPHPHSTPQTTPPLDGEAAFRESLFDALGDDEGAAYWESGPDGELERMDEEEYATYVRAQMWTRTREGMMAEQDRLRAERRQAKILLGVVRRGGKGRLGRGLGGCIWRVGRGVQKAVFRCQDSSTATADGGGEEGKSGGSTAATPLRNLLFWPVESGKRCDVTPAAVEEFLKHAPEGDLLSTLKVERVRWHPDKIQHRYGVLGVDEKVMRSVTEVFQIVDRMWNEERERVGKS
ncbi:hypothetical protein N7509_001658 [Penicillium cosmopolitanum]|uniref:Uncharacterized protein n=1 Tax=Penicillium cosmopolitanum TaxID=1131564 RepID=A0A9X0BCQ4_9EURO|nr:uncharacterized protein N7509_001658 [Penicillium cosmopolitanum]KAJ5407775.1 hypothetical protein N7509_001658 [Penicillium cosmopolitanum]